VPRPDHTLTTEELAAYAAANPHDAALQALGLPELLANTGGGVWDPAQVPRRQWPSRQRTAESVTACELDVGYVVFDVICLAIGGIELRAGVTEETAEAVAEAARPVMSKIETTIAEMARAGASATDIAKGVFDILVIIWSGGCLGAVVAAFVSNLTWYYSVLYGATALATIIAAVATDGVAFVAEVALEVVTFGMLVADCVNAVEACDLVPSAHASGEPVASAGPAG
jgi:hypothetical protein